MFCEFTPEFVLYMDEAVGVNEKASHLWSQSKYERITIYYS